MKRLTLIILAFFLVGLMAGCVGVSPFTQALGRSAEQQHRGDLDGAIAILLKFKNEHEKEYEQKGQKLTLMNLYANLALIYTVKKDYRKVWEYAQEGIAIGQEIERIGLANIDDDGQGRRRSRFIKSSFMLEKYMFMSGKYMLYSSMKSYYTAGGETGKAEEMRKAAAEVNPVGKKVQEVVQEILKAEIGSDKSLGYEAQAAENERRERQRERHKDNILYAEILKNHSIGETKGIDDLIEQWVRRVLNHDLTLQELNSTLTYDKDIARVVDYYIKYVSKPWAPALKASMLFSLGRAKEAEKLIDSAIMLVKNRPALNYNLDKISLLLKTTNLDFSPGAIPFSWRILKAQILMELGNEYSADLLEEIMRDKPQGMSLVEGILYYHIRERINLMLSEAYIQKRNYARALSCLEEVLSINELVRASFFVEDHRMGFLAANKGLYERYLEMSSSDPSLNLLAMERAKSRAMVDLMAQGVRAMNVPTLKKIAELRDDLTPLVMEEKDSGKRGLKIKELSTKIQSLKVENPELHSLAAVDIPSLEELEGLANIEDVAAISYYLMDDALYINLFAKGKKVLKKIDVSKMGLFESVREFRSMIQDANYLQSDRKKDMGIDISWFMEKGREILKVQNNMSINLEIISMRKLEAYSGMSGFPSLPFSLPEERVSLAPLTRTVVPGESRIILDSEKALDSFRFGGATIETLYLDTNIGTFTIKGVFKMPEGANPTLFEIARSKVDYMPVTANLYDILITPVEKEIKAKHLIIVPHGPLHFLPFEALKDSNGKYLVEKYSVSYVPALNVLKYCRAKNQQQKKSLVAFADPLGDLKFAKSEVEQIKGFFSLSKVLAGSDATVQNVKARISEGDFVHFACHGVYDPISPLNSSIILCDKEGKPSLLSAGQIMAMKFKPYLVVVSACNTGLARLSGGDELIGLARGFFVAGSPSLVTTLWPINDKASSILITRFYENMIVKGMNKAEALRDSKIHLIKNGYKSPYYWAAFVLQGDWQ